MVLKKTLESPLDPTSPSSRKSVLTVHWKDWCWSWKSNTLATWCKELTHWRSPWCWERLKAGGEGGDRGWDGWMASPTQWTGIWASCRRWWWTGKPGVLQSTWLQRAGHDWASELNWTVSVYTEQLLLYLCLPHVLVSIAVAVLFSLMKYTWRTKTCIFKEVYLITSDIYTHPRNHHWNQYNKQSIILPQFPDTLFTPCQSPFPDHPTLFQGKDWSAFCNID